MLFRPRHDRVNLIAVKDRRPRTGEVPTSSFEGSWGVTNGEMLYLAMVVSAFTLFAVVLAAVGWQERRWAKRNNRS